MKVRIVCYEDVDKWILGKFALKMQENLTKLGIECDIAKTPDKYADINHHIIYLNYNHTVTGIDTLMITHVDNISKKNQLQKNLQIAQMGICMSNETMVNLMQLGIPREKLCYINPSHDGIIKPRPKVVGITCRVQEDGRKREYFLSKLAKDISPVFFSFKIMGDGWEKQVEDLKNCGFIVEYIDHFNYDEYIKLIPSLDYYLYMGQDEGQMGFIDALAAGIDTIVTRQGYHLDAIDGISYPFSTYGELVSIFKSIENKRRNLLDSIATWNWQDYTKKHLEIWNYLINQKNTHKKISISYNDGINSICDNGQNNLIKKTHFKLIYSKSKLYCNNILHYYLIRKNIIKKTYNSTGAKGLLQKILFFLSK